MVKMLDKPAVVGPEDAGRRMSLDEFDRAVGKEGFTYELHKGVIQVSGIPQPDHGMQVQELRDQLTAYRLGRPGVISYIAAGSEAKILLASDQSERHPDLSLYLTDPPDVEDVWSLWVPAIVIEVVSTSSAKRDYDEKPGEYLAFGIDEYWIVDRSRQQMTAFTRWRGDWKEKVIKPTQKFTTHRLAGFTLDLRRVFSAGKKN
jgi:Uma2 family endonuclease